MPVCLCSGPPGTAGIAPAAHVRGAGWRAAPGSGQQSTDPQQQSTTAQSPDENLNNTSRTWTQLPLSLRDRWSQCNSFTTPQTRHQAYRHTAARSCRRTPAWSLWVAGREHTTPAQCHRRCPWNTQRVFSKRHFPLNLLHLLKQNIILLNTEWESKRQAPNKGIHFVEVCQSQQRTAVYPGSMQSWMSATHEFFCNESMVSKMYSAPFSTCNPQDDTTVWSRSSRH